MSTPRKRNPQHPQCPSCGCLLWLCRLAKRVVGRGDVLMALAQAFSQNELPEEVTVQPASGLPKCAEFPIFQNATASSIAAPACYDDSAMNLQCKLQSWSYRLLKANV